MRLLLDTHVALWLLFRSDLVPEHIKSIVGDASNEIFVSSVSIFEIAIKHSIGKKSAPPLGGREAVEKFGVAGYEFLAVTAEHAAAVDLLPAHHKDPFDRLLIAQAIADRCTLSPRTR